MTCAPAATNVPQNKDLNLLDYTVSIFFYLHDSNKYEIKLITYQIKSNLDTNIFDKSIEYDKNIENINK